MFYCLPSGSKILTKVLPFWAEKRLSPSHAGHVRARCAKRERWASLPTITKGWNRLLRLDAVDRQNAVCRQAGAQGISLASPHLFSGYELPDLPQSLTSSAPYCMRTTSTSLFLSCAGLSVPKGRDVHHLSIVLNRRILEGRGRTSRMICET